MFGKRPSEIRYRLRREFWEDLHKRPQQDVEKALVSEMGKKIGNSCNQLGFFREIRAKCARYSNSK